MILSSMKSFSGQSQPGQDTNTSSGDDYLDIVRVTLMFL